MTTGHTVVVNDGSIIDDDLPHFVGCIWDGTTLTGYVDGQVDGTSQTFREPIGCASNCSGNIFSPIYVGGGAFSTELFRGKIDELFLTDSTLATSTIRALYNNGSGAEICVTKGCGTSAPVKEPILIVPGIMGSHLNRNSNGFEVWPSAYQMALPGSDHYLDDLGLSAEGKQIPGKEMHANSIVEQAVFQVFYGDLVNHFRNEGYAEGKDLFLAPYDWRFGMESSTDVLGAKISAAIAASPNGKINIVAHSMGGLLVKKYLAGIPDVSFVDKLILLGAPQLGAPEAAKILNYGDDLDLRWWMLGLNSDEVKRISQNMPSIYELLPSRNYVSTIGSYIADFRPATAYGNLEYDQAKQVLVDQGRNAGLLNHADAFHAALDGAAINAGKVYNILGCKNFNTIGQIQLSAGLRGNRYDLGYISGDGTVPFGSAASVANAELTYYAPFDTTGVDHMGLVKDDHTIAVVQSIIDNQPLPASGNVSQNASPCTSGTPNAIVFETHSPVALHVYDSAGNHLGPTASDALDYGIVGAGYNTIEHNSFARVPAGGVYKVLLQGTTSGTAELDVKLYSGATVTDKAVYLSIPIQGASTTAELDFSGLDGDLGVKLDTNGDGVVDAVLQPDAVLGAASAGDLVPPVIIMPNIPATVLFHAPITFNFSAADENSGVASLQGILDGNSILRGTVLANLAPGSHTFTVQAIDKAGNPTFKTLAFSVVYRFGGFLPPIKTDGSGVYSLGRTLPVKFHLTDANGRFVSLAVARLVATKQGGAISGTSAETQLSLSAADNGSFFRYDPSSNQYMYNLNTRALSMGTWQLKVVLDDGASYVVIISLR